MALSEHGIYQHWSDNVARNATLTADPDSGSPADETYGPDALVDDNPAKVAKIDATTGAWIEDFGEAQRVDLVGLIHHDFDEGADVRIQAADSLSDFTSSPASPDFDAAITIPPWLGSGSRLWPVNPWLDLTTQPGYSATGWRYWRLVVTGNSQNLQLGQLWLSPTIRRFDPDVRWGVTRAPRRLYAKSTTVFEVDNFVSRSSRRWSQIGDLLPEQALADALEIQWDDVDGAVLPWLLVPDGAVNNCYLVRWDQPDRPLQFVAPGIYATQIKVIEAARGLRPGV
ncbi:MAG TPA: hypothetical protein VF491_17465 [Vicinamibacterales bacterium]